MSQEENQPENQSRRDFLQDVAIVGGGLFVCALCGELGFFAYKFNEKTGQLTTDQPDTPTATKTATATQTATKTATPPNKNILVQPINPYRLGPFNLEGEKGPAPHFFTFIQKPDGKVIKSYFLPKTLQPDDDPDALSDWHQPINIVYQDKNLVVITGHSGTVSGSSLPLESLRVALEGASRPFNRDELAATISELKNSKVSITQGELAPGYSISMVTPERGLQSPAKNDAKIKEIIRLDPVQKRDYYASFANAETPNIFNFTSSRVSLNPKTDFGVLFCGQKFFPGEKANPLEPYFRQTAYLVIFSLIS